jgi:hypothetical protein
MSKYLSLLFILFLTPVTTLFAQSSVSLSVSPTLFEMSASPGQDWKSNVRVINTNDFDMVVYANIVNFAPKGEGGDGLFLPVFENETQGMTLAEWVKISREPILIPRQQTMEVPFSVSVPMDANPGGHFAAILIGTKPPTDADSNAKVQTSQMVTSLFFVKIAGDVIESGAIREFRTTSSFLTKPEATLELRFENKGNVHIQPQGDIRIYNMWGQERGIIPINRQSHFGNVLPESVRKFTFSWKGEWALADIGRYSAMVTLGYGSDGRQFVSSKTFFWVVPIKELSFILLGIGIFITLIVWFVRLYVRRMLVVAGFDPEERGRARQQSKSQRIIYEEKTPVSESQSIVSVTAPLKVGILDLRTKLTDSESYKSRLSTILSTAREYWKFIMAIIVIVVAVGVLVFYIKAATTDERAYEVTYINAQTDITLTSEDITYNKLKENEVPSDVVVDESLPSIIVVNRSGIPGSAAKIKLQLESLGYGTVSMEIETEKPQARTVVVYAEANQQAALDLSKELNNALVSISNTKEAPESITVFVGGDINKD